MRLNFQQERVLAVVAHPDDAELLCAGTLARARDDGATIGICVMCRGDKGRPAEPVDDLPAMRRTEMAEAAGLIEAELLLGEFADGELVDSPEQRRRVVELFRQFRPTLVLAHWPDDYHADHRAAGRTAEAASWFCTSAGHETAAAPMQTQPALWWMDTTNMGGFEPGFFVDVSVYLALKREMLACHRSQLLRGGEGDFSPLDELMVRQCRARGNQAGAEAAEAFRSHLAWKRCRAW